MDIWKISQAWKYSPWFATGRTLCLHVVLAGHFNCPTPFFRAGSGALGHGHWHNYCILLFLKISLNVAIKQKSHLTVFFLISRRAIGSQGWGHWIHMRDVKIVWGKKRTISSLILGHCFLLKSRQTTDFTKKWLTEYNWVSDNTWK